MNNKDKEYLPMIEKENNIQTLYICFKDKKIRVSKEIFLQFFGVHKQILINGSKHYFIVYKNQEYIVFNELPKEEYCIYQSFVSMEIREQNIYDRYIEHKEVSENNLFHKGVNKDTNDIVSILYEAEIHRALYEAIESLSIIQKRRLSLHYQNGLSLAQIAQKERCSKSSVQCSIQSALATLNKKLKKFKI